MGIVNFVELISGIYCMSECRIFFSDGFGSPCRIKKFSNLLRRNCFVG